MFKVNYVGTHALNGGSVYRVKAGETAIFDFIAVQSTNECAAMNAHPVFISLPDDEDLLQIKQFVPMVEDYKGKRFATSSFQLLVHRYVAYYVAQLFVTKESFDVSCPDDISALTNDDDDDDDDQNAIDEDGSYGLDLN